MRCLPCFCSVSCAQLSFTLEPDNGLCAHVDERTCIRVITVYVTSSVQAENKCSAVAMWMVCGSNTPPDEGGQNYLHLASWRSANCTGSV